MTFFRSYFCSAAKVHETLHLPAYVPDILVILTGSSFTLYCQVLHHCAIWIPEITVKCLCAFSFISLPLNGLNILPNNCDKKSQKVSSCHFHMK